MNKNRNDVKLYNLILPPFLIVMFAPPWMMISLIGNFLIDSLLLIILFAIFFRKLSARQYVRTIFKVWGLGYASDFIGVLFLMIPYVLPRFINLEFGDTAYLCAGIALASVAIFLFDYFVSFRNCGFTKKQRIVSSIAFAVLTTPYTFMLPQSFFI